MSEMLDKEDPGPTYAEIQAALNAAEATITFLRAELERKDAALRSVALATISGDLKQWALTASAIARAALSPAQKEGEA